MNTEQVENILSRLREVVKLAHAPLLGPRGLKRS